MNGRVNERQLEIIKENEGTRELILHLYLTVCVPLSTIPYSSNSVITHNPFSEPHGWDV